MILGVDYDTWKIHVCGYDERTGPRFAQVPLRRRGDDLQTAIKAVPTALTLAVAQLTTSPADAWVERGRGPNRNVDWDLGAIAGAILSAYPRIAPGNTARLLDANQWKSAVGARGNQKASAHEQIRLYHRSRHSTQLPDDPNLMDAYGIALAATRR